MQLLCFERREESARDASAPSLDFETLEYRRPGPLRLGARIPPGPHAGDIIDLNRAFALKLGFEDAGAPEAEADSLLPSDSLGFLRRERSALALARSVLDWALASLERFDAPDLSRAGVLIPERLARLRSPIPRPGKLIGVARNYAAHAAERGQSEPPEEPVLFIKSSSAVIGPGDDILLPAVSQQVDYEGELAVLIGSHARGVPPELALDCVAGYTVANDVSARDFQNVRGQRFIGKSCDSFAPLGPLWVTSDEVADPQALEIRTTVSGELRQSARTSEMIFSVAEIIAFASQLMTLEPGDVILTGTPSGVGAAADPPRWLRDGDVVDVEIDRIGRLRNYVRKS